MNIKNYTSSVPIIRSISQIEDRLVEAGATHISKSYNNGKPDGILFQMIQDGIPVTFQLPAKIDSVRKHFIKRQKNRRLSQGQIDHIHAQAERTAWKILSDLVHIRLSYIELESAEFIQLFLADAFDGKETFYDKLKAGGFKQLTA